MKNKIDFKSLLWALAYVLIAFGIIYILDSVLRLQIDKIGEISLSIFLLLPLLAYLIFSDKLKSLKAGGVEIAFNEFANKPISIGSDTVGETLKKSIEVVEKSYHSSLPEKLKQFGKQNQNKKFLTIQLGFGNSFYGVDALKSYIKALSAFSNFFYIVVLDNDSKAIAFIDVENLLKILDNEGLSKEFEKSLNEGNISVLEYSGMIKVSVREDDKNIEVLQKMDRYRINQLLVVDKDGHLKDIVERNELLTQFFISISTKLKEK